MKYSRRNFFKYGIVGALALGTTNHVLAHENEITRVHKEKRAKRMILIAFDGVCVDGYVKAKKTALDALFDDGVLSLETRVVMPSITQPNWTSILTGSGPEQHGVLDNDWTIPTAKLPAVEKDADGYYPSVFKVLKENVPHMKTAFYYNWGNLINPYNRKYLDETNFLENDEYVPNCEKALSFLITNRNNPTLVFLYTGYTDNTGHAHKWMSPEYIRAIEDMDAVIGEFVEKLKAEGLYDDSHFMFLTDHGGIEYGHGGITTNEMIVPWAIKGPGITKGLQMKEPNNTVNTASVILKLFGVEQQPACWTGEIPMSIFGK